MKEATHQPLSQPWEQCDRRVTNWMACVLGGYAGASILQSQKPYTIRLILTSSDLKKASSNPCFLYYYVHLIEEESRLRKRYVWKLLRAHIELVKFTPYHTGFNVRTDIQNSGCSLRNAGDFETVAIARISDDERIEWPSSLDIRAIADSYVYLFMRVLYQWIMVTKGNKY